MTTRLLRFTVLALQRQAARDLASVLAQVEMTPSQAEVISVVGEYGPLSVRQIGEYLICESGSPSRLVQTLVERGLLARAISSSDRRASFITLTPAGRSALRQIEVIEARYEQELSTLFNASEVDAITAQLRRAVTDPALRGALDRRFPSVGGKTELGGV